jgi:hypothetical protein
MLSAYRLFTTWHLRYSVLALQEFVVRSPEQLHVEPVAADSKPLSCCSKSRDLCKQLTHALHKAAPAPSRLRAWHSWAPAHCAQHQSHACLSHLGQASLTAWCAKLSATGVHRTFTDTPDARAESLSERLAQGPLKLYKGPWIRAVAFVMRCARLCNRWPRWPDL